MRPELQEVVARRRSVADLFDLTSNAIGHRCDIERDRRVAEAAISRAVCVGVQSDGARTKPASSFPHMLPSFSQAVRP
jgi:hypothetical protein